EVVSLKVPAQPAPAAGPLPCRSEQAMSMVARGSRQASPPSLNATTQAWASIRAAPSAPPAPEPGAWLWIRSTWASWTSEQPAPAGAAGGGPTAAPGPRLSGGKPRVAAPPAAPRPAPRSAAVGARRIVVEPAVAQGAPALLEGERTAARARLIVVERAGHQGE